MLCTTQLWITRHPSKVNVVGFLCGCCNGLYLACSNGFLTWPIHEAQFEAPAVLLRLGAEVVLAQGSHFCRDACSSWPAMFQRSPLAAMPCPFWVALQPLVAEPSHSATVTPFAAAAIFSASRHGRPHGWPPLRVHSSGRLKLESEASVVFRLYMERLGTFFTSYNIIHTSTPYYVSYYFKQLFKT